MIGRNANFLGLAIGERAVVCAEVAVRGSTGGTARRTATFALPAELSLDASPESVGAVLGAFLREHKFTATRCVVGVPARWLIAVEREVPPSDDTAARAMLRLQAERLAVAESGEVVFDFAGKPNSSAVSKVLLVGMLRQRLERIEKIAEAAGLDLEAVTSTGLALAACASGKNEGGLLVLTRGGGEIVWRHDNAPRMLRHVAVSAMNGHGPVNMAPLTAELRRAVTLAKTNGGGRDLLLLDGLGLEDAQVSELSDRLGVKLKSGRNTDVCGIASDPSAPAPSDHHNPPARYAPAMSLALAGARAELRPVDFKHSRLAPEKVSRFGARGSWGMVLGGLALLGVIALYVLAYQRQNQLDELNAKLKEYKPDVAAAQSNIDRFKYARGFFQTRPPVLDCLAELSKAFGEHDRAWVKTLVLPANGKGTINGQAADDAVVLEVVERIKKNPRFTDVKGPNTQQADPRSREVSFTVTFTFNAVEHAGTTKPATAPATVPVERESRGRNNR
jgi:hypothetical protein